jgi:hypothetical protein
MTNRPYTNSDKWVAASLAGLLFLLLSSPYAYSLSASIFRASTLTALLLHALLYTIVLRLLMGRSSEDSDPHSSKDKWMVAMVGGTLFLLLSSPFMYEITNSITSSIGYTTADKEGVPRPSGLVLSTLFFVLITRTLMG